jgi:nitrous oxidase accessory protein
MRDTVARPIGGRRAWGARLALAAALAAPPCASPAAAQDDHATTPGALEGRPTGATVSPLQALVDAASAGATVEVAPGVYDGDLLVDKAIRLVGRGRPLLRGSGTGSVIRVRADGATIEGFDIDGRGGGDLGRDSAGIHIAASRVTVRDCRIRGSLFGIYLREAHGAVVEGCRIDGIPGKDPGEKGSGIHVWNTSGFTLAGNVIRDVRDGFYIQSSSGGVVRGNRASDLRYGLHYMFSDDNVFEDNTFERGAAGTALMYSRRIQFRRNRFVHNRGFASVGLLLKECDDVTAEDNLIGNNARGIFLEGSYRNVFRRNIVAGSDMAIVLYDSSRENRFEENAFVGNMTPLMLVGRRTDTVFAGNYWSGHPDPDLDGDGVSDRPYRLTSVFDHLRGNLLAADLYVDGFAGAALGLAERTFPVLAPVEVYDARPLARPPALPEVPRLDPEAPRRDYPGLAVSALALVLGAAALQRGRTPRHARVGSARRPPVVAGSAQEARRP